MVEGLHFWIVSGGVFGGVTGKCINDFSFRAVSATLCTFACGWVGLSGVVCLFWQELQLTETALTSLCLCLIGTLFFCTGNMVSVSCQKRGIPVFASTSWGMFYGACYLAVFSLISHHEFIIEPTAKYMLVSIGACVFGDDLSFLIGKLVAALVMQLSYSRYLP